MSPRPEDDHAEEEKLGEEEEQEVDLKPNGDDPEVGTDGAEPEEEVGKKKKTHMKVAADAPWKDRMWEGAWC